MDVHQIFTTPILLPESENVDFDLEWNLMVQREAAILKFESKFIQGTLTQGEISCLADNLAEHDIEPYNYLDQVFDNIRFVIANQIPIEMYGLV